MTAKSLYLDHAATTPLLPEAREAMMRGFAVWANPSSPHAAGRAARAALEDARDRVKRALGWPHEIVFTASATEALALAARHAKADLAAVSSVEHDAVLRLAGEAVRIEVDACGRVDPARCGTGGLVAVQQVNSETGVVQPLDRVAAQVRRSGGLLLADCAQGAGKLDLPDADLIAVSAHKFGGPIGVGALLVREWALLEAVGGQERGYRPGTENLPGALAMAAALEAGRDWLGEAARLRVMLEEGVQAAGGEIVAAGAERCPTIGAVRMPGLAAALQLIRFDVQGIAVSAGSACSSGSMRPSHVLAAMRLGERAAAETIRVSIGRETREADVVRFLDAWQAIARSVRTAA
ncbi:aminotransferase [Novosphingobium sp. PC22D]|uniref:cysteine desulfurase family protein n=1 Tax=Novosphingobium sp. PC22D TaxID=1962403 RepID=UPI000BF02058|nr:aminotransferase class V-fold PLP-dependent enzyme [Novosphingobium sp. PC22D]PEQ13297.1 aminotransferase [Novosphingobium sp. PC22D]